MRKIKATLKAHFSSSIVLPDSFHEIFNRLDNETRCHCIRCARYLLELDWVTPEEASAALLHDLGKLEVPMTILKKRSPLSPDEWAIIKNHPKAGASMIEQAEWPEDLKQFATDMALYHHERWNGTGYPYGLKGKEIPYCARVMAIIDTIDAMTSHRTYQKKVSKMEALSFVRQKAGTLYDPELVAKLKPAKLITL